MMQTSDPFKIIPDNWELPKQYKVVCFFTSEDGPMSTMVGVMYPDYKKNGWGYSTTLGYTTILRDYYIHTPHMDIINSHYQYVQKRGEEAMKKLGENPCVCSE